jgi:pimeloyl-ACP methyl ester carboxylesterase
MVDILVDQLANNGIHRPHVVGNSLGGWLALELARRGLVSSVTCFSPAGSWPTIEDFNSVANNFRRTYAMAPVLFPLVRPLLRFPAFRRILNLQVMEHGDRAPVEEVLHAMSAFRSTRILPPLLDTLARTGPIRPLAVDKIPIAIAWGECDKVIPFVKYGVSMLASVPAAKHSMLSGCGHVPMYDDPQKVALLALATTSAAGD